MTAHRSRAEVDRMYRAAVSMRRAIYEIIHRETDQPLCPGDPVLDPMLGAMRDLDGAIMEYNRPITLERTFNALRDAVTQAETEIDKYHRLMKEQSE